MDRQAGRGYEGGVLVALIALVVGLVLAGLGSAALVSSGTSGSGSSPITAPLVKYDSP